MTQILKPKATCALVLTAYLLMTATIVLAQKGTSVVRRIRFPRGRTTAVLKGSLRRGVSHDYLLRAHSGQTMTIHLASSGGLSFVIIRPGGESIADYARDWSGEFPLSGDYRINLLPDTTTNRAFPYTLEVTIR